MCAVEPSFVFVMAVNGETVSKKSAAEVSHAS